MSATVTPANEVERLSELRRYEILDTPPEEFFDRITAVAASLFQTPISLISLVDQNRVWFKSRIGMGICELAKEPGLCSSAIQGSDVYVVSDAQIDIQNREHSLVKGENKIRFYAAAPLTTRRGYNIGALCILDTVPRDLSEIQRHALKNLAAIVMDQLEIRLARKDSLQAAAEGAFAYDRKLFLQGPTMVFQWKANAHWIAEYASPNVQQLGYQPEDFTSGKILYSAVVHPDDLQNVEREINRFKKSAATSFDQEYRILTQEGQVRWIYDRTHVVRDETGAITNYCSYLLDETVRKHAEEALKESWAKYEAVVESFDGHIYICSADYKVEFMNKRLLERTKGNPIGQDCYRVLHHRDSICPWCVNDSVLRGKTVRWEMRNPKDNRWYYVINSPITHPDGRISKMAMILDVTERKQVEEQLRRREAILEAVAFASESVMKETGWEQCVQDVLANLGKATGVDRVSIFENRFMDNQEILCTRKFEWSGPGVASLMYNPEMHDFSIQAKGFGRWTDMLSQGSVIEGPIREFPEAERAILSSVNVRSVLVVPVFVERIWWGFIGFDSCTTEREWSTSEIDALKTAGRLLGTTIQRRRSEEALRASETRIRAILNAIPDLMFRISQKGVILDCRAENTMNLVLPRDQVIGKNILDLLPAPVAQEGLRYIQQALVTGERQQYEYELSLDGKRKFFECRMVVCGGGEVLSIVRDITDHKEAEAQLTQLSLAVEQSADSILITDRNGCIEYVNPAFERLTGYTQQEVIGKTPAFLKSGRHPPEFYEHIWKTISKGEVFHAEFVNRRKDGRHYYQGETITPIKDSAGNVTHFVSSGRDITESVAAHTALKESEQRLSDIINFLPDATFVIDSEGKIISWNRAIETMTGVSSEAMLGKGNYEYSLPFYGKRRPAIVDLILHPVPDVFKLYAYVEKARDTLIAETLLPSIGSSGIHAWIIATPLYDAKGHVTGAIESIRDITDRKNAEESIRKLAAFPQFNPNPILEFTAEGTLSYFNKAAKELSLSFGQENIWDILPPDTVDILRACLNTKEKRSRVEVTLGGRTISWSFFPILEIQTVHAYGLDITERLDLEMQMRHLQKMEAVGRLAGGVAHDFNNILTAILGYSNMLLLEKDLAPSVSEQLQEIAKAAERASQLTGQLLMFSRKQTIQLKVLDLNETLGGLAHMLQRIIGEDIALEVVSLEKPLLIRADQSMLEQVLVNLVINARDAMPKGGQITISAQSIEISDAQAKKSAEARPGKFICLHISDTGVGMSKDVQARIFEPFFTTKERGKGTGLGLATAYGIVKQHDGWIELNSEEQHGSTFTLFFPQWNGENPTGPKPSRKLPVQGGNETILLVEDEPAVRMLAFSVLAQYGYHVLEAASGAEGLRVWEKHEPEIDMLLTDVVMPGGITGGELAEQLLQQKPTLKVLMSSGYHLSVLREKFSLHQGIRFLPKPFSPEKLARTVRECLDGGRP